MNIENLGEWMRCMGYYVVVLSIIISLVGCGSSSSQPQSIGADVIQKYQFSTVAAQPVVTTSTSLPLVFTDRDWNLKQAACQEAGYDLTPYAGQTLSLSRFSLNEMYFPPTILPAFGSDNSLIDSAPLPLYLWVLTSSDSTVCSYASISEDSTAVEQLIRLGAIPQFIPVNDTQIQDIGDAHQVLPPDLSKAVSPALASPGDGH